MKKTRFIAILCLLSITFLFISTGSVFGNSPNAPSVVRKIVVFENDVTDKNTKEAILKEKGGIKIKDLETINAVAANLPVKAIGKLLSMSEVKRIDDDIVITISKKPIRSPKPTRNPDPDPEPTPVPSQTLPWGIDRIDAELVWGMTNGTNVKVAVVDTGIDMNHPDLAANVKGGYNAINTRKSADDDNGHGSHVAGTIAALNNSIGVVGAGPAIDLYAVKVLDRRGSGYVSDIIEGIGWCINNGIDVINMSLSATVDVQSFHDAVIDAEQAGIVLVAAAGNSYFGSVEYPAAYAEVIAVSATDFGNTIANFSSIGPEVDVAAPGVSIESTYKNGGYDVKSGTSMASPHVAGAVALIMSLNPSMDGTDILQLLTSTATDLGAPGVDDLYGAGLINVYKAITQ